MGRNYRRNAYITFSLARSSEAYQLLIRKAQERNVTPGQYIAANIDRLLGEELIAPVAKGDPPPSVEKRDDLEDTAKRKAVRFLENSGY